MGDKADELFSLYIRTRDKWTCQKCYKKYAYRDTRLHCSHFKGRGKEATRFEPLNCDALCEGCHGYFTDHPQAHESWQVARKGQGAVDMLIRLSNSYKKKDRSSERAIWRSKLRTEFGLAI